MEQPHCLSYFMLLLIDLRGKMCGPFADFLEVLLHFRLGYTKCSKLEFDV